LRKAEALFKALQDAGDADLDELIEIAGGDGEELYALEQGIGGVVGFFKDAAVELEPTLVAIDESAAGGRYGRFGGAPWCRARGDLLLAVCFRTAMRLTRLNQGCAGEG